MAKGLWRATPIERSCLAQLNDSGAWRLLGGPRPGEEEPFPATAFWRILGFNLMVFIPLFSGLVALGWSQAGEGVPSGTALVSLVAAAFALAIGTSSVAAGLYRRAWNRRARSLRE